MSPPFCLISSLSLSLSLSLCLPLSPACVKDLIRALRNDDSRCEIRRQLGQAGILQKVWVLFVYHKSSNYSAALMLVPLGIGYIDLTIVQSTDMKTGTLSNF